MREKFTFWYFATAESGDLYQEEFAFAFHHLTRSVLLSESLEQVIWCGEAAMKCILVYLHVLF